jgi:hypothetical protein
VLRVCVLIPRSQLDIGVIMSVLLVSQGIPSRVWTFYTLAQATQDTADIEAPLFSVALYHQRMYFQSDCLSEGDIGEKNRIRSTVQYGINRKVLVGSGSIIL